MYNSVQIFYPVTIIIILKVFASTSFVNVIIDTPSERGLIVIVVVRDQLSLSKDIPAVSGQSLTPLLPLTWAVEKSGKSKR
jgi:hypothetical protein